MEATPLFSCTIVHSLNQLRSSHSCFLTGFTTVHVNCTLIRERPLSFCGVGVRRSTEQHGVFRAVLSFSELRNVGVSLAL